MAPPSRKRPKSTGTSSGGGFYQQAGHVLNTVWENKGRSLKSVVYDKAGQLTVSTAVYALCTKVLQAERALTAVLAETQAQVRNKGVWYATLYDALTRSDGLQRGYGGAVTRYMKENAKMLQDAWQRQHQQNTAASASMVKDTTAAHNTPPHPRYVRVNTLRTTTEAVQALWKTENLVSAGDGDEIQMDPHIPDLLVLPASATPRLLQFTQSPQSQKRYRYDWILQDKSSCFSAYCLVHGFGRVTSIERRVYLDSCAAPGNKTTHLAALVEKQQQKQQQAAASDDLELSATTTSIYALDRSQSRFASLRDRVAAYVPSSSLVRVQCDCQDFLQTHSSGNSDYDTVTDILLDPSCSGSGMPGRQFDHQSEPDNKRLDSLQGFQVTALRHALTAFTNVQRVVYSTCSVHTAENEAVVSQVLAQCNDTWELVAPTCLQDWSRRGRQTEGLTAYQAAALIRVDPALDGTHGFFVACFRRRRSNVAEAKMKTVSDADSVQVPAPPQSLHSSKPPMGETIGGSGGRTTTSAAIKAIIDDGTQQHSSKKGGKRQAKLRVDDSHSAVKRPPAWVQHSGKKKRRRR
jgi:putative methyltransferase